MNVSRSPFAVRRVLGKGEVAAWKGVWGSTLGNGAALAGKPQAPNHEGPFHLSAKQLLPRSLADHVDGDIGGKVPLHHSRTKPTWRPKQSTCGFS